MKLNFIIFAILSGVLFSRGQGTFLWDQQVTGFVDGAALLNFNQPLGQPFTPSFSSIDAAAFYLSGGPVSSSVELNVRSGSVTGTILGTSELLTVDTTDSGVFDFVFSNPITLTPGTQYFLQPVAITGGGVGANLVNAPGSTGTAIYNGTTHTGFNFWFQEGVTVVPEPSSVSLLGLASGMLYWRVRRIARHREQKARLLCG